MPNPDVVRVKEEELETMTAPIPVIVVDETEEEKCCLCWDPVEDNYRYYRPPCGHLFCYQCMDQNKLLRTCTRCNQNFMEAGPVLVRVAFDVPE